MSQNKCCICGKQIKKDDVIIRLVAEAVKREKDEDEELIPELWENAVEWKLLHMVHVTCAVAKTNHGFEFEYGREINELPLEEIADEWVEDHPVYTPPLRLVQGGR